MILEFSGQNLENSNMKFNENPCNESRVVPCGRTDRRTDMTKLIVAFRNVANVSKYKNEKACILINAETPENTNVT